MSSRELCSTFLKEVIPALLIKQAIPSSPNVLSTKERTFSFDEISNENERITSPS